jgi:hypothetical protein
VDIRLERYSESMVTIRDRTTVGVVASICPWGGAAANAIKRPDPGMFGSAESLFVRTELSEVGASIAGGGRCPHAENEHKAREGIIDKAKWRKVNLRYGGLVRIVADMAKIPDFPSGRPTSCAAQGKVIAAALSGLPSIPTG